MKKLFNLFLEIFPIMPKVFFILFFFVFLQSFFNTLTLVSLTPLVDFLTDNLETKSKITIIFENIFINYLGFNSVNLVSIIFFIASVVLISGIFSVISQYVILVAEYRLYNFLLADILNKFLITKYTFFTQSNIGEIENTILHEVRKIAEVFAIITRSFALIIQFLMFMTVPLLLSPLLTFIFIFLIILLAVPVLYVKKFSYNFGKGATLTANKMIGFLHQTLYSIKIIQSFSKHDYIVGQYKKHIRDFANKSILYQTSFRAVNIMFLPMGIIAALITLYISFKNDILLADLVLIFFAFLRALPLLTILVSDRAKIAGMIPAYEQVLQLRKKTDLYIEKSGKISFTKLNNEIILQNLTFSFPKRGRILDKVNIKIKKGFITCLTGGSGSGKSTVVDIIMGLHNIDNSQVFIDDIDINEINLKQYREKIGYVPQETILFNMSIKDNILWANQKLSNEELDNICKLTNIYNFINELPDKFDTIVGDKGVRLSGGQKQRIGLARAVAKQPTLLILDEATSNLDSQSELLIQNSIKKLSKDITIFVIAHRQSSIKNSDIIYLMEKGKIIDYGNYDKLVKDTEGSFFKLIKNQLN